MKVFVVNRDENFFYEKMTLGVFSTEELAKKVIAENMKMFGFEKHEYEIEEFEINGTQI